MTRADGSGSHLNELTGTVISFETESGRYGVRLVGEAKPKAFRACNLRLPASFAAGLSESDESNLSMWGVEFQRSQASKAEVGLPFKRSQTQADL